MGGLPDSQLIDLFVAEDLNVKQIQVVRQEKKDLNPVPPDYKSSALTTRLCHLQLRG